MKLLDALHRNLQGMGLQALSLWAVEHVYTIYNRRYDEIMTIPVFIKEGEWGPAFNAQNRMLDAYAEKYNLQDQDWRPEKAWYKPSN